MIFLANRANLDRRTLLTRLHTFLQTQVTNADAPIEQVWYHTSAGNKVGIRATIDAPTFLGTGYSVGEAELHVSFDFPPNLAHDVYRIQWVEPDRGLMLGWHQDESHPELGGCHLQVDYQGETVQRAAATYLDMHPMNVFETRIDHLVEVVAAVSWENGLPKVPEREIQ